MGKKDKIAFASSGDSKAALGRYLGTALETSNGYRQVVSKKWIVSEICGQEQGGMDASDVRFMRYNRANECLKMAAVAADGS